LQFRCRGSRRESAVAQLFSLGIIHTLMKKNTKKKAIIATACVAVYFGAYFLLVHPILGGPPEHHVRFESYINPFTRCEAHNAAPFQRIFWPAHQVDVLVRHGFWFPT